MKNVSRKSRRYKKWIFIRAKNRTRYMWPNARADSVITLCDGRTMTMKEMWKDGYGPVKPGALPMTLDNYAH